MPTSNAVLLEKIEALSNIVIANQSLNHEAHGLLLGEARKTNGRVTKLEGWKNQMVGGLVITNIILVPAVLSMAISLFKVFCVTSCG